MEKAIAIFYGPKVKGTVTFTQSKNKKVLVTINLKGLPKNKTMGFHIHEYGDERDGCNSLGGHWNPTKKEHGSLDFNTFGHHWGDLCNNISSNSKGNVNFNYTDPLIKLTGKHNIFGRSVVIHAGKDDLGQGTTLVSAKPNEVRQATKESLITGNAGKRIACGIIVHYKN